MATVVRREQVISRDQGGSSHGASDSKKRDQGGWNHGGPPDAAKRDQGGSSHGGPGYRREAATY